MAQGISNDSQDLTAIMTRTSSKPSPKQSEKSLLESNTLPESDLIYKSWPKYEVKKIRKFIRNKAPQKKRALQKKRLIRHIYI